MGLITRTLVADKTKQQEGTWIEIGYDEEKQPAVLTRIKVRRVGSSNKEYRKEVAKRGKKYSLMRGDKDALQERAIKEAVAHTCVVEWENMENLHAQVEGEPPKPEYMPCTPENVLLLFEVSPDTYEMVMNQATDLESYRSEGVEDLAKNLPTS